MNVWKTLIIRAFLEDKGLRFGYKIEESMDNKMAKEGIWMHA